MTTEHILKVLNLAVDYSQGENLLWRKEENGELVVAVNCNDIFHWACADSEEVTPENLEVYRQSLIDCQQAKAIDYADVLFVARVRQMRPQGATYPHIPTQLWPLLDACGPERKSDFDNPYNHPSEPEPSHKLHTYWCSLPKNHKGYCRLPNGLFKSFLQRLIKWIR